MLKSESGLNDKRVEVLMFINCKKYFKQ